MTLTGCIRAIMGYPKSDVGYVDIIVWEHQFEDNEDLYDWEYLYSNNLVPDAAVTHEYWYTKSITLGGALFRVSEIEYKPFYAFRPEYKEKVLQILSDYVEDLSIFECMDPCTIINEWVPENLPLEELSILLQLEEELVRERDADELLYDEVLSSAYGEEADKVPDYDITDMLVSFQLERLK